MNRYYLQTRTPTGSITEDQRAAAALEGMLADYPQMREGPRKAGMPGIMVNYDDPYECAAALAACMAANGVVPGAFPEAVLDTLRKRITDLL